jgi:hypothetical protein
MTGNRILSQCSIPSVNLFFVARSAVTGNIVLNTQPPVAGVATPSIVLSPDRSIAAITGNVFQGSAFLPSRFPITSPPEDPWIRYNTQF